jgi:hypothetical protein
MSSLLITRAWSWRVVSAVAGLVACASGAAAQPVSNEVVRWSTVMAEASTAAGIDPLHESRLLAIAHLAMHDAINAVVRRYEPYRPGPRARGASAAVAAASAAHTVLVTLLPASQGAADAALTASIGRADGDMGAAAGLSLGRTVATRLLAERKDDGRAAAGEWPAGSKPGAYRPTPPENIPAFLSRWGTMTPFALKSGSQLRPVPPPALGSDAYAADVADVQAIGAAESTTRTAEQTEIAKYWYEHSTQGWNRIAREVASARRLDLWESARLFALVNVAMADGFIAGFEAKYHYNVWRPITAIREAASDGNAATKGDPAWQSVLSSPRVPDYPSTHTVLGAAAAAVLARVLGTDFVPFSMTSGAPYGGITRRFWSFSEAAQENGASRVFAGIHFPTAVRAGYQQGEAIGVWAVETILTPVAPRVEETAASR